MKTISIPGAIYSRPPEKWEDAEKIVGGRSFQFFAGAVQATFAEWTLVCPHTLTFTPPADWNPVAAEVEALQAKKAKATAAYQAMVTDIDRRINELLAIENGVAA